LAPGSDISATSAAWFDELRLAPVLAVGFRGAGLDEAASWAAADHVRVLLALPRPSEIRARGAARDARLIERWAGRDAVRAAMGVNTWEGVEWLDRERFTALLEWAVRLDAIDAGGTADRATVERLAASAAAAGYRMDRLVGADGPGARGTRGPRKPGSRTPKQQRTT
jgi:hypothetical protein